MAELLSFALFASIFAVSAGTILVTFRAELPYIRRALGIAPPRAAALRSSRERHVRLIRRSLREPSAALRYAA